MRKSVVLLADALDRLGVLRAVSAVRRRGWVPGPRLTVLVYHRIADPAAIGDLDPTMIDATPETFDAQMAYLARHFRPIGLEDLLAAHRGERTLEPGSVLVTFDDGYRDNFEQALPILKRHGMKAIFFISTGHVNDRRIYWWETISLLVRRASLAQAAISYPALETFDLATDTGKARATRRLNRIVKDHFALDLDRFLAGLHDAFGVAPDAEADRARAERSLMTWDQVRGLRAAGMGVGSHTRGHRVLQTLPPDELAAELRESRATLERELGEPITTIAYPVGKRIVDRPEVRQAIAEAGYEIGFSAAPGMNSLSAGEDRFDLKRLFVDRDLPIGLSRVFVTMPALAR